MFGRGSSNETKVTETPRPPEPPRMPLMAASPAPLVQPIAAAPTGPGSIFANDLTIIGQQVTLVSRSTVLIDGRVDADVRSQSIVVGPSGNVTGTLMAANVEVRGKVKGAIKGTTVTLQPTARVEGEIVKLALIIAEGAHFDGSVRRARDAAEVTPDLTSAPPQG